MAEAKAVAVAAPTGSIGKSIAWTCKAMAVAAGLLFCIEMVMSTVSVIGRITIGKPIPGDFELVQLLSGAGVALCLPYCQLMKGHVFVDFFTLWAPPGLKRILDATAALLLALCAFLLAWRLWLGMLEMREYGEASMVLGVPIWWGYVPVVPGVLMLGIAALYTFAGELRGDHQS